MKPVILMSMIALSGCAANSGPTPVASPLEASCNANAVQDLIGKPATTNQMDAQRRAGAGAVRRYETGSPVTMDFRADRLNIETDTAGTIVKLSCG